MLAAKAPPGSSGIFIDRSRQLVTLINLVNIESNDFSSKMSRYLKSAALIVLIQDGPIRDIFNLLQDHVLRAEYISNIPKDQADNLSEYVNYLKEIDEWSKPTKENQSLEVIGTRTSAALTGILDRVNKLKDNTYMELMLKRDIK